MIIFIDDNDENMRLDNFLSKLFEDISRSKIQTFIKDGKVLVNSVTKKPAYILKFADKVEFDNFEEEELVIEPQDIPLEIIYEDANMLVVNKPSGMLTHPTSTQKAYTLVNALLYKFCDNLSDINGAFRRGIVHRLDKNTSGLLMIAKNNLTHEYLAQQIKDHSIVKKYRAIIKGNYNGDEDKITQPIGRNPKQPHKMAVVPVKDGGKESITLLKVLERYKEVTYVELTLITGRTHQIRVHMSYMHHPIYNDSLYGSGACKVKTEEQVLQSFYLKFAKPFSDEIIELEIEPDEKINKVLGFYKNRRIK